MRSVIVAAAAVALAACSTYDSVTQKIAQSVTPYRITVVQGNFVSAQQAAQLHVGMTRDEVRALLGTPLLTDLFHAQRWDYVFYFKRGFKTVVQQRDLILNFTGDTLASWSGGEDLPSDLDLLTDIDGQKRRKPSAASAAASASAATAASAVSAAAASGAQAADAGAQVTAVPDDQPAVASAPATAAAGQNGGSLFNMPASASAATGSH